MLRDLRLALPLLALLASSLGAPPVAAADAQAAQIERFAPEPRIVLRDGASVRREPGFVYGELRILSMGQEIMVDGRQGKWLRVRPEGWIFEDQLVAAGGPPLCVLVTLVVTKDGAAVRERASDDAPTLRTLAIDEIVRGRVLTQGWWELSGGGFVAEDAVHEPGGRGQTEGSSWRVGADSANVRASASTDAAIVRKLVRGDRVAVSAVTDGWCQVQDGFIRADLLVPPGAGGQEKAPIPVGKAGARRWGFVDLEGTVFTIEDIMGTDLVGAVQDDLRSAGITETDWTYLGLSIGVPEDATFRFNFDAAFNSVVIEDQAGESYGSIVMQGPMEKLPAGLRALFLPEPAEAGEQMDVLLLFVPSLKPAEIRSISMHIGDRLQQFYPLD